MNSNISSVFSDIPALKDGLGHISFCADDKLAEDLDSEGHIDHHVRVAIRLRVEPVKAYRMATLNPAVYYRLDHLIGSVTPGKLADLLILSNLEEVRYVFYRIRRIFSNDSSPSAVIVNGKLVAENNEALFANTDKVPEFTRNTIHIHPDFLDPSAFHVKPLQGRNNAWVQAVEMYDGYFKRAFHAKLQVSISGYLKCDLERDILKVVVIDRHHYTRNCGIAFVRGFGLKRGAIACTTNCENQNLVVIGTSDEEIAYAVKAIQHLGGGFVAVLNGDMVGAVKLDVAGCMSSEGWEKVRDDSLVCDDAVRNILGGKIHAPFMIASFVGLVGVPDLGLTELGLVDCKTQGLMDVVLSDEIGEDGSDLVPSSSRLFKICCRCPSHSHDVHRLMDKTNLV